MTGFVRLYDHKSQKTVVLPHKLKIHFFHQNPLIPPIIPQMSFFHIQESFSVDVLGPFLSASVFL